MRAAELYTQVLDRLPDSYGLFEKGKIVEQIANSYSRAANQAPERDEFVRRMKLAESYYREAGRILEAAGDIALSKLSMGRGMFATFYLKESARERREVVEGSAKFCEQACQLLESPANIHVLAEAHMDMINYLSEDLGLSTSLQSTKEMFARAVQVGDSIVVQLDNLLKNEQLLEALQSFVTILTNTATEPDQYEALAEKRQRLVQLAGDIATKIGTVGALARKSALELSLAESENNVGKMLELSQSATEYARGTSDSSFIGDLLARSAQAAHFQGGLLEDTGQARSFYEKTLAYAKEAIKWLKIPLWGMSLDYVHHLYAETYTYLALDIETNRAEKIRLLQQAVEIAKTGQAYSQYTETSSSDHALSKALYFQSLLIDDDQVKQGLLLEALSVRAELVKAQDRVAPNSWYGGVIKNYLALIQAELAKTQSSSEARTKLLREATVTMRDCIGICGKWVSKMESPSTYRTVATYNELFGDTLLDLYALTSEKSLVEEALKAYSDARSQLEKAKVIGPIGVVSWKIARAHANIGDHKHASTAFENAAENYQQTLAKIPGSASLLNGLCSYMRAMSFVELARLYHADENYSMAMDRYAAAAELLVSAHDWSFLSPHYSACNTMEKAEMLSRQDNQESAIDTFKTALKTLKQAEIVIAQRINEKPSERLELKNLLVINQAQDKYCEARIQLEEAKVLDQNGNEAESATRYDSAAETFRKLTVDTAQKDMHTEFEVLALFCDAWAKMNRAELEASSDHYLEAAEHFRSAAGKLSKGKNRILALANVSICEALRTGIQFQFSHDSNLYSELKRHLEVAASNYEKIGSERMASWTRATQRLYDAAVCSSDAESERDSKKKKEYYHLAEKNLEMAARLYGDAGYKQKQEEALKQMKRAYDQKELLLTPGQTLAETTSLLQVPVANITMARDQTLGLERLQSAHVVGRMIIGNHQVAAGSQVDCELEMTNCGKTVATLLQVENLEGLTVDKEKSHHMVRNGFVDLKKKRVASFESFKMTIPLKMLHKGTVKLSPRISYTDDMGHAMNYEFEPEVLTVSELGISGWLKGPK